MSGATMCNVRASLLAFVGIIAIASAQNSARDSCMYGGAACLQPPPYVRGGSAATIRWSEFFNFVTSCVQRTAIKLTREGTMPYIMMNSSSSNVLDVMDSIGYFEPLVSVVLRSFYSLWISQDSPSKHLAKTRQIFDIYCRRSAPEVAKCLQNAATARRFGRDAQDIQQMTRSWIDRYCVTPSGKQPGSPMAFRPDLRLRIARDFANMAKPVQCLFVTPPGTSMEQIEMNPNMTNFWIQFSSECLDMEVVALLASGFSPSYTAPSMKFMTTRMTSMLISMGRCGLRILNDYCPAMLSRPVWNQLKFYIKTAVGNIIGRPMSDADLNWNTSTVRLSSNRTTLWIFGRRHATTQSDSTVITCQPAFSLAQTYVRNRYFEVSDYGSIDSSRMVILSFYDDAPGSNGSVVAQYSVLPDVNLGGQQYQGLMMANGSLAVAVRTSRGQITYWGSQSNMSVITDYRSGTVFILRVDGPSITLAIRSPADILRNSYGIFVRGCLFPEPQVAGPQIPDCYQACNATTANIPLIKWCSQDCVAGGTSWVKGYGYIDGIRAMTNITDANFAPWSKP